MKKEERPPDIQGSGFVPLTFDVDEYRHCLAGCELTEAEERKLLEALWSIMVGFVDLGFRINPVQQAVETLKEDFSSGNSIAMLGSDQKSLDLTANKTARCVRAFKASAARKGRKT